MEPSSSNGLMGKIVKFLRRIILFSFIIAIITVSIIGLQIYQFANTPLSIAEPGVVFEIANGTSMKGIARKLKNESLISHTNWFLVLVKYSDGWGKLKAGEYLIKPGTTPITLIQQFLEGKVIQHSLTIVEGWTFDKLMQIINQSPKLAHSLIGLTSEQIMEKIGFKGMHPEGRFFPETYFYIKDTPDVTVLKRALLVMETKLLTLWSARARDLPFKSPYEALIMASIIEKESSVPEEYAEISGVYVRRLQRDMLLQADPTVIYGLGQNYTPPLTLAMLRTPTPYNTYLYKGLPPTPIGMPGAKALNAAMHPEPGNSLFFVAKPDGKGHIFANNYEEHKDNVKEYRARTSAAVTSTTTDTSMPTIITTTPTTTETTPTTPTTPDTRTITTTPTTTVTPVTSVTPDKSSSNPLQTVPGSTSVAPSTTPTSTTPSTIPSSNKNY